MWNHIPPPKSTILPLSFLPSFLSPARGGTSSLFSLSGPPPPIHTPPRPALPCPSLSQSRSALLVHLLHPALSRPIHATLHHTQVCLNPPRPISHPVPPLLCSALPSPDPPRSTLPCPDPPRSTLLHHIPAHTSRPRSFLLTSPRPALPCPALSRSSPTPTRPATSTLLTTSYGHCSN
ncbi:hypothetical protein Pcinc_037918 [Petrolisthes cinctipes]|uniref:Uncharacterized protein n=1 Tax=Petrolisthes cinctipes TaxID=88211 RepID=A0AAE1BSK4_PETCI|nr:hypothetical protein Pcinc_037918 [Petrolisthes cinctipes]